MDNYSKNKEKSTNKNSNKNKNKNISININSNSNIALQWVINDFNIIVILCISSNNKYSIYIS